MTKKKEEVKSVPKGAIVVGKPAPVGSVAAAAERQGVRPRKRGPGVQIYVSKRTKAILLAYSEAHGINMKFIADGALGKFFETNGIDVELYKGGDDDDDDDDAIGTKKKRTKK